MTSKRSEQRQGGAGRSGGFGELFKCVVDEEAEIPAVEVFVGGLTSGVVAAGENFRDIVDAVLLKVFEDIEGELAEEGEVVGGMDDKDALGIGRELPHVGHGADGSEDLADEILGEASVLEGSADVAGGLAGPDDVAEPGGGVIEGADAQARIHGGRDEGVAGAERGAEDAELGVALLLEPVEARADIEDGLPAGGDGAANIGADGVVRALEFGRAADVVVGLGEAEGGDAEAVEESAEGVMGEGVGVPLGHDDDGLPGLAELLCPLCRWGLRRWVPAGIDDVVLGVASADGRGEAEELGFGQIASGGSALEVGVLGEGFGADVGGKELRVTGLEAEVCGGLEREEAVSVSDEAAVERNHPVEIGQGGIGSGAIREGKQLVVGGRLK